MTTQQVADRLVTLWRQKEYRQAQDELYADTIISLKPDKDSYRTVIGLTAIGQEEDAFLARIEQWHENTISDPVIGGAWFSVAMTLDVTMTMPNRKPSRRVKLDEICVHKVVDGQITNEQFFM